MPQSVIGAQMYTVHQFLKTPADVATSCAKIRKMGYENVQVSGLGPIDTAELVKILDGEGLKCVVTHVSFDMMKDTAKVLDYHAALKCKYTAVGGFFKKDATAADWETFATDYSAVAKTLAAKGLHIGYHNHSHELAQYSGKRAMDLLLAKCDKSVWFEIDTYWITHGGGDPIQWIDKVAGRIPCVHFKDMGITADRGQIMTEVGSGNLNWPGILASCKKAGVEWYLVERDSGALDAFESLKVSLENLRAMGLH